MGEYGRWLVDQRGGVGGPASAKGDGDGDAQGDAAQAGEEEAPEEAHPVGSNVR
jgi:hypothetical protein